MTKRMRPLLGTFVEIGITEIAGVGDERALAAGFAAIELVQRLLSFHDPASDLSRLNQGAGAIVELHPVSLHVLRLARAMMVASGGLFNCTVGGQLQRLGVLPRHSSDHGSAHSSAHCGAHSGAHSGALADLPVGHAGDIEIRGTNVRLVRRIAVTLDGIAKGYAVDRAVLAMRAAGALGGWVNAGGDLRVFGRCRLPVQRREIDGRFLSLGDLQNTALATSAVHATPEARFPGQIVLPDGVSRPQVGVWSVLASSAWRADALTKVAALAPEETRWSLVARLGGQLFAPRSRAINGAAGAHAS